jgi:hypothetical protein
VAQAPVVIARGARQDTGLTRTSVGQNTTAIGYATGDGTPHVFVVAPTGNATHVDVDWSHLREREAKKDPKLVRRVHRVTPLGYAKVGGKMRVGVDLVDSSVEKNAARYLRCGPADSDPITVDATPLIFFEATEDSVGQATVGAGGHSVDVRECRTFSDGVRVWTLSTQVRRESQANRNLVFEWLIDDALGDATIKAPVIDRHVEAPNKDKKYAWMDHFVTPLSVYTGPSGFMMVARDEGQIVFAHRDSGLEQHGAAQRIWLGGATFPSLAHDGDRVIFAVTEARKLDLLASAFPVAGKVPQPVKVALVDPNPATEGSREGVSLAPSGALMFASFADGKAPKRRVRFAVLGADLKPRAEVFDVTGEDATPYETRVVPLDGGKALVLILDIKGDVTGVVVSCKV